MSSTYPASSVNALVGLGLVGSEADNASNLSPSLESELCPPAAISESSNESNGSSDRLTQRTSVSGEPVEPPEPDSQLSLAVESSSGTTAENAYSLRGRVNSHATAASGEAFPQSSADSSELPCENSRSAIDDDFAEFALELAAAEKPVSVRAAASPRVFHRVAEVRKTQGLTERTIAKRLGIDIRSYRQLECASTDLTLSQLVSLQRALEVPLIDLIEDSHELSRPVQERAQMVKIMKTAVAMRETSSTGRIGRLAEMLCTQLANLMPELKEVGGWPQFGARRGQSAIGRALAQPIDTTELRADR